MICVASLVQFCQPLASLSPPLQAPATGFRLAFWRPSGGRAKQREVGPGEGRIVALVASGWREDVDGGPAQSLDWARWSPMPSDHLRAEGGDKRLLRGPVRLWIAAGHHRSVVVSPLERALGAVRFGLVLWRAKSEWGRRPRATRQAQVSASQTIRIMRSHLDRRGGGAAV